MLMIKAQYRPLEAGTTGWRNKCQGVDIKDGLNDVEHDMMAA